MITGNTAFGNLLKRVCLKNCQVVKCPLPSQSGGCIRVSVTSPKENGLLATLTKLSQFCHHFSAKWMLPFGARWYSEQRLVQIGLCQCFNDDWWGQSGVSLLYVHTPSGLGRIRQTFEMRLDWPVYNFRNFIKKRIIKWNRTWLPRTC